MMIIAIFGAFIGVVLCGLLSTIMGLKGGSWKLPGIGMAVCFAVLIVSVILFAKGDQDPVADTSQEPLEIESQSIDEANPADSDKPELEPEPEESIVIDDKESYGDVENFSYKLSGDKVLLRSPKYNNKREILEIPASFTIDGITYTTDLSDFHNISRSIRTLILCEGITEINTAIFNSSDVQRVFFPKSMTTVYDYTLSYMHPDDGETIKIYYAGTQEEWAAIFKEYKRTPVGDAEFGYEMGVAAADWLNEKLLGAEYDSSLFEYHFSATPSDLK